MQMQEFHKIVLNNLENSNLRTINMSSCGIDYIIIYETRIKDILDIINDIYNRNLFNEKNVIDKCPNKILLDYILNSKFIVPAIATINTETLTLEVEIDTGFSSTSKYFSTFQDIFLLLGDCMNHIENEKYRLQNEYDKVNELRTRIETATYPVLGLMSIYKDNLKNTPFYKFRERKKWKDAIEYISDYRESKIPIVKKELEKLNKQIDRNTSLQDKCEKEYICLSKCREYLCYYVSNLREDYYKRLYNIHDSIYGSLKNETETYNHNRYHNGWKIVNSKNFS